MFIIENTHSHIQSLLNQRQKKSNHVLTASYINTKLGPMLAIANETTLYLLEFMDKPRLKDEIEIFCLKNDCSIILGETLALLSIQQELNDYYSGTLKKFETPLCLSGTTFHIKVWQALLEIPYGETRSYAYIAGSINNKTAYRAVAQANARNRLAIIIPCHRVINSDGKLGGYAGGFDRKKWLIHHENYKETIS